ncbi:MAG: hypothetical protein O9312_14285 [Hylemonella sp.]|nr:hypothetical protein [Hylemonella sp.]
MARTEAVLTIFLASPSDVFDERNRFEDAISEWNRTWARNLGLRLEVLRWEHDAYPDAGEDAQAVINQQIPHDYDIFVGVMWSRFGTPTGRSGSGTAEEFDRAFARYQASPNDVSILFYFKDTPISPSKLDPEQLLKVQEFKNSLKESGVLCWDFAEPEQFEKLAAMHITRHVQNWRQKRQTKKEVSKSHLPDASTMTQVASIDESVDDGTEDGYLDLLEIFAERNAEVTEITNRLNDAQTELTVKTSQGTSEIQALTTSPQGATPAQARRIIGKVATEMLLFTQRVNAEVPLFRAAINSSMSALTRAATLSVEFDREQTHVAKDAAGLLLSGLGRARQSMAEFKVSTLGLPRITKELNVAKRKQAAAIDALIGEFENAEQLMAEAIQVMDTLLRDED